MTTATKLVLWTVDLESSACRFTDMLRWENARMRIGSVGSGSAIELDEPGLSDVDLRIYGASGHLILEGEVAKGTALPALGVCTLGHELPWCSDAHHGAWQWNDPAQDKWWLAENKLYVRFDRRWLRIGRHALRLSWEAPGFDVDVAALLPPKARPWWRRLLGGSG